MGDFRSKLRARISRRHSGIPLLPSSRNGNASSNSTKSVEPSSPASAHRVEDAETALAAVPQNQDGSHIRQATGSSQAQGQLKQGSKHHPARVLVEASDASSGKDGDDAASSGSAAVSQNPNSATSPTNNSPLLPASPGPGKRNCLGNDRRILTDSEPFSGNKSTTDTDTIQQSSPSSPPSPTTRSAPVDEPRPRAPRVSTDVARRARVSDPPVSLDLSSPASRPAASGRPSFTPQDPVDPALSIQSRPSTSTSFRPSAPPRRQSLLPNRQTSLIRTLLNAGQVDDPDQSASEQLPPISPNMATRKLWVKRPSASATLVTINEEDLVDDVRELILRKYGNTLGRQFDAPDLTLRIVPRESQRQERVLGPEEPMARTLDAYFPGGQSVDEALLIDIPHRRTPRASPRNGPPHAQHLTSVSYEDMRPLEGSTDYFGPGAVAHIPVTIAGAANGAAHSISVLNTGQVPQIPSPGGTTRTRPYRDRPDRPRPGRQHTSSPTILNVVGAGGHTATIAVATNHGMQQASSITRSRTHSSASSEQTNTGQPAQPAPPLPTPPSQESAAVPIPRTATPPPPRAASPRPPPADRPSRPKKKKTTEAPALPAGMLNGGVPPINVLIVEDNIINLRLLEAFVKRLKVRWQTAMNGREAVTKWRAGGFHLVLMDIQLPVMSGLEATREIRRLERTNSIGAFSTTNNNTNNTTTNGGESDESKNEMPEEDKLQNREMFKSPVIIVALTASSLQSDRHEALAAGCNDFLTKPVTYVWLERKVMEWGCMQALIDYDGWRKWKSYTSNPAPRQPER